MQIQTNIAFKTVHKIVKLSCHNLGVGQQALHNTQFRWLLPFKYTSLTELN